MAKLPPGAPGWRPERPGYQHPRPEYTPYNPPRPTYTTYNPPRPTYTTYNPPRPTYTAYNPPRPTYTAYNPGRPFRGFNGIELGQWGRMFGLPSRVDSYWLRAQQGRMQNDMDYMDRWGVPAGHSFMYSSPVGRMFGGGRGFGTGFGWGDGGYRQYDYGYGSSGYEYDRWSSHRHRHPHRHQQAERGPAVAGMERVLHEANRAEQRYGDIDKDAVARDFAQFARQHGDRPLVARGYDNRMHRFANPEAYFLYYHQNKHAAKQRFDAAMGRTRYAQTYDPRTRTDVQPVPIPESGRAPTDMTPQEQAVYQAHDFIRDAIRAGRTIDDTQLAALATQVATNARELGGNIRERRHGQPVDIRTAFNSVMARDPAMRRKFLVTYDAVIAGRAVRPAPAETTTITPVEQLYPGDAAKQEALRQLRTVADALQAGRPLNEAQIAQLAVIAAEQQKILGPVTFNRTAQAGSAPSVNILNDFTTLAEQNKAGNGAVFRREFDKALRGAPPVAAPANDRAARERELIDALGVVARHTQDALSTGERDIAKLVAAAEGPIQNYARLAKAFQTQFGAGAEITMNLPGGRGQIKGKPQDVFNQLTAILGTAPTVPPGLGDALKAKLAAELTGGARSPVRSAPEQQRAALEKRLADALDAIDTAYETAARATGATADSVVAATKGTMQEYARLTREFEQLARAQGVEPKISFTPDYSKPTETIMVTPQDAFNRLFVGDGILARMRTEMDAIFRATASVPAPRAATTDTAALRAEFAGLPAQLKAAMDAIIAKGDAVPSEQNIAAGTEVELKQYAALGRRYEQLATQLGVDPRALEIEVGTAKPKGTPLEIFNQVYIGTDADGVAMRTAMAQHYAAAGQAAPATGQMTEQRRAELAAAESAAGGILQRIAGSGGRLPQAELVQLARQLAAQVDVIDPTRAGVRAGGTEAPLRPAPDLFAEVLERGGYKRGEGPGAAALGAFKTEFDRLAAQRGRTGALLPDGRVAPAALAHTQPTDPLLHRALETGEGPQARLQQVADGQSGFSLQGLLQALQNGFEGLMTWISNLFASMMGRGATRVSDPDPQLPQRPLSIHARLDAPLVIPPNVRPTRTAGVTFDREVAQRELAEFESTQIRAVKEQIQADARADRATKTTIAV